MHCKSITLPLFTSLLHFLLDLHHIFSLHFAYASFSLQLNLPPPPPHVMNEGDPFAGQK